NLSKAPRSSRSQRQNVRHRRLGRLSPPDSREPAVHRQGFDGPDRAGQQQHSPLLGSFPPTDEGRFQERRNGRPILAAISSSPRQSGSPRRKTHGFPRYLWLGLSTLSTDSRMSCW